MDLGTFFEYVILFVAGTFAAGTLAYVVLYCAVRGAMAGFIRSIVEQTKHTNDQERKGD